MPSTTKKQARFMNAAAHNPSFAKAAGVPQSVAKEFSTGGKAYEKLPERKPTRSEKHAAKLYDGK